MSIKSLIFKSCKILVILTIIFAVLIACAGYGGYKYIEKWGENRQVLTQPTIVELQKGMSLRKFSQELEKTGLVDKDIKFELWTRIFSDYSKFQAGPYRFKKQVSPQAIAKKIIRGKVYRPVIFKFTVPEGFTYRQLTNKLVDLGIGTTEEFETLFTDIDFINELKVPAKTLEGFIYPATYSFLKMPTPRDFVRKAVNTFWRRLPEDYQYKVEAMHINLLQAVTMASLIEMETPQASEKPLISEVIWRRLKANMSIGIDAAIIYGIKDYKGNITAKHLSDAENLYNTRIHKGLPPSPIGSPALDSLMAVLHPAQEGNYYFVVDPDNPKHHVFAKNFAEHSRNVRRYVVANKRR